MDGGSAKEDFPGGSIGEWKVVTSANRAVRGDFRAGAAGPDGFLFGSLGTNIGPAFFERVGLIISTGETGSY